MVADLLKTEYPQIDHIYAVGSSGLRNELEGAGIKVTGVEDHANSALIRDDFDTLGVDESIKAVVAGIDWKFNYYKLCYSSTLI